MNADPEVLRGLADAIEVRIALADGARGKAFEREIEALGDILYVRGKEIIAALRAPQKDGAAAMQWKPTGSGTASINGMGGTTEWFRQFDGRRESYPHGFNPNIGGYVDVRMGLSNPPPLDLTTEAQNAARTLSEAGGRADG